jgi:hypothetical protein
MSALKITLIVIGSVIAMFVVLIVGCGIVADKATNVVFNELRGATITQNQFESVEEGITLNQLTEQMGKNPERGGLKKGCVFYLKSFDINSEDTNQIGSSYVFCFKDGVLISKTDTPNK